jgi:hypothetical protein
MTFLYNFDIIMRKLALNLKSSYTSKSIGINPINNKFNK